MLVGNYRIGATGSVECQQSGPDFTVEKSKENAFRYPPSVASSTFKFLIPAQTF